MLTSDRSRIKDIIREIDIIGSYIHKKDFNDISRDLVLNRSLLRSIGYIAEHIKKLSISQPGGCSFPVIDLIRAILCEAEGSPKEISEPLFNGARNGIEEFKQYLREYLSSEQSREPVISAVMVTFDNLANTKAAYQSLVEFTDKIKELIIVDNGSSEPGFMDWFKSIDGTTASEVRVRAVFNHSNEGFAKAANNGIRLASNDLILLMHNDIVFSEDTVDNLAYSLLANPDAGIAAPVINYCRSPQRLDLVGKINFKGDIRYSTLEGLREFAKSYQSANKGKVLSSGQLTSKVLLFKKTLAAEMETKDGYFFDPLFSDSCFEDIDLSRRVLKDGHTLIIAADSFVHHEIEDPSSEKTKAKKAAQITGERKYRGKWDKKQTVIAMMAVHNEDEYLIKCLNHLKSYVDGVVILDDRSDNPKTLQILSDQENKTFIKSYFRNPDNYPRHQGRDKDKLLQMAKEQDPEWILQVDPDEVFEDKISVIKNDLVNPIDPTVEGYIFEKVNFWDSEELYRSDNEFLIDIMNRPKVRLFRNQRGSDNGTCQNNSILFAPGHPADLDISKVKAVDVRIKHYGYMHKESRKIKLDELPEHLPESYKRSYNILNSDDYKVNLYRYQWNPQTISVCMIVKDETSELERCLSSIDGLWDELIVVWNGKNPETEKILKNHKARIIRYEWKNDFADARNTGIKEAKCDWIMYIDADEYLGKEEIKKIRGAINATEYCVLNVLNIFINEKGDTTKLVRHHRIFRNNFGFLFDTKIHEQMDFKYFNLQAPSDFRLFHTGYSSEFLPGKSRRNLKIIIKEIRKCPDSSLYYFLGRDIMILGKINIALWAFNKVLEIETENKPRVRFLSLFYMAKIYYNKALYEKSIDCIYQDLQFDPLNIELLLLLASIYFKQEQYTFSESTLRVILMTEKNERLKTSSYGNLSDINGQRLNKAKQMLLKIFMLRGEKDSLKELYANDLEKDKTLGTYIDNIDQFIRDIDLPEVELDEEYFSTILKRKSYLYKNYFNKDIFVPILLDRSKLLE